MAHGSFYALAICVLLANPFRDDDVEHSKSWSLRIKKILNWMRFWAGEWINVLYSNNYKIVNVIAVMNITSIIVPHS